MRPEYSQVELATLLIVSKEMHIYRLGEYLSQRLVTIKEQLQSSFRWSQTE